MTNQPLTAENIAIIEDLIDTFRLDHASKQANAMQAVLLTAQQNAVAEGQVKVLDVLLDRANTYIGELEAENERLKQAAALFREASFQGHSSHWDSQGTSGANCPACSKASNLRRQADDLLSQPPKEAT